MSVKLPTPLSPKMVDRLLDEKFEFQTETWTSGGVEMKNDYCRLKTPIPHEDETESHARISNYGRALYELLPDIRGRELESEDEDGYICWFGEGSGWEWTAEEWTEEQIDNYLGWVI